MTPSKPPHSTRKTTQKPRIRVGTSGWIYRHWRTRFYPADLTTKDWFAYYARYFDTVEINNTFYRLPMATAFDAWRKQAPGGFLYAIKASRFLTHMKKLKDPAEPIDRILSRARRLKGMLGPVLYQLPRGWHCNLERLTEFFRMLPRGMQHVMEYRSADWLNDEVFSAMHKYSIGLCIHDLLPKHPRIVTSKVVYVRFHGSGQKYGGSYPDRKLREWGAWMRDWRDAGQSVYAYFNNDAEAHAARNASTLREIVER